MQIMAFPQAYGYEVVEKVGVGSYAVVYKAHKKSPKKEVVAIKCIEKRLQKSTFVERVVKEISVLKMLHNEYIVKLIDFMWDPKYIFIITEFCDEGDLSHYIRKKHKLGEPLVKMFMQQMAIALKYLRKYNICHMDLKPQNLLLCSKPNLKLKVADFGLSQIISPENAEQYRYAGSLLYMAPEKILNQKYDARVDLWSVGIIMYECLFGRTPFGNIGPKALIDFMHKRTPIELPKYANVSGSCANLLSSLLKYNPDERIGFDEFFKHEFLDLIHVPTIENYLYAVELVKKAVDLDKQKKYSASLPKYKEAVQYLEAFIPSETDLKKRAALELKLAEYKNWATMLERALTTNESIPVNTCQISPLNLAQYNTLYEMAAMTPQIATGLDIGAAGEMYLAEGKKGIALEKLTTALELLLPMLENEPTGPRKEMLHSQIQKWLHMAETVKKTNQ